MLPPRYRWIKLFLIAYSVTISVVIAILLVMRQYDRPEDRHPITVLSCIGLILFTFVISFLVVSVRFANSQYPVELELEEFQKKVQVNANNAKGPQDYPGVTVIPEYSPPTDGPGQYRIQGVNRETRDDTTIEVPADSLANAKIKAELNGIIVTSVTKTA